MSLRFRGPALACVLLLSGCALHGRSVEMARIDEGDLAAGRAGMAAFTFDDFGGLSGPALETNALPWKVMATALLMAEPAAGGVQPGRSDLPRIFRRYGFLLPDTVANWRGLDPPAFDRPIGMTHGMLTAFPGVRIEAANLGCASCHAGVLYDAAGLPTRNTWLGLPNTSLDLEAFSIGVYRSLLVAMRDRGRFAQRIQRTFPMSHPERLTLRWLLLPRVAKRLAALESTLRRPTPFLNGGPGRTNGTGALKLQLGILDRARVDSTIATISVPNLAWRGMRSSFLVDGCYGLTGQVRFYERGTKDDTGPHRDSLAAITALFTMGVMGLTPERASRNIPAMRGIMEFLESAGSPAFPGPVDDTLAAQGRELFENRCSGCHGSYAEGPRPCRIVLYPNRRIREDKVQTDSLRWTAIDSASIRAIGRTPFGGHIDVAQTGGYVPPILSGVWATAPYFHNGSVPTVWHVLHPDLRPERFEVGGHRLDFTKLGIAGEVDSNGVYRDPSGYVPWSQPEIYDTRKPGQGRQGHEGFVRGLSDAQDRALIEFLKCL